MPTSFMLTLSLRNLSRALTRRVTPLLLLSLALAFATSPARAQAIGANRGDIGATGGTGVIQGHIVSPSGKLPATRIRVTLSSTNGGVRSTAADDDGNFTFSGIEPGPHDLLIDAGKDYETGRESVFVEGSQPIYNVPIYLRLKPEANPALAGVPKPALDLYSKALDAERKNDDAKAASLLTDAVAQYPQFGLAHGELGLLYLKTNQLDKAVGELKVAQKALPDDPQIAFNYGFALEGKSDYEEAEKQLRRAVKRMDKNAQAHMYLGIALMRQKGTDDAERQAKIEEAEREFQQSVKLGGDPGGLVHYYLGGIYWSKRDYKKAADELELYLKASPKAANAEQVRATIKDLRAKK
ncbi:MAG TPA: tetratricopeptide repeat protein [Pyrinomonadaceae bacterium]|nr:tetratricopeptide repeat protein [Pyrinomonadaceae bacterium]